MRGTLHQRRQQSEVLDRIHFVNLFADGSLGVDRRVDEQLFFALNSVDRIGGYE